MSAWYIALKDLQVFFKDRGALIYLLVLPVVFILLFVGLAGAANLGSTSSTADQRLALPVVNLDAGGPAALELIDRLDKSATVRVQVYGEAEGRALLADSQVGRILTIPAGFSADIAAGRQTRLLLSLHPNANPNNTEGVGRAVNAVARDLSLETQLLAGLKQMSDMQPASSPLVVAFQAERLVAQAKSQFERAKTAPLVAVEQVVPDILRLKQQQSPKFDPVQGSVAGFTILFVFLAAQTTAQSIHEEKNQGSFRRLLAAPIGKGTLLAGKMLPNLITTVIQIVVIFAVGVLLLPVLGWGRVSLGSEPLTLVLVSLLVALCSTSLGLFIASMARSESQISGLSTTILWVAGAIGGSFLPTFMLPGVLQTVGKLVPHYWANQAYYDLLVRGQGLSGVGIPILALVGFTVAFFAIGLWRFDYD